MTIDLSKRLRSRFVLHHSWSVVRTSGFSSLSEDTQRKTRQFDDNWLTNIDRLRNRLKHGTFKFSDEIGVAAPKAGGKPGWRPLVVAPIENRIVRRAILEVLQGYGTKTSPPRNRWSGIPAIRQILETPTSVGGIPKRGVPHGLSLIDHAVSTGHHWFIRSDIRDFFTRIPLDQVNQFICNAIQDQSFCDIFSRALATNLANKDELEERNHFKLFPTAETGAAQGSALSALAGNIILQNFDTEMNGREIVCVRYIDDFIVLGKNQMKVSAAFRSAQEHLKKLGMTIYDIADEAARKAGKVDSGNIHDGTDVLGYHISARSLQPSKAAKRTLLRKIDKIVADAKHSMREAATGRARSHTHLYHHALTLIHRTAWGWSQAFKYTNTPHALQSLDTEIQNRIIELQNSAHQLTKGASFIIDRRVRGIHLLQDFYAHPLPDVLEEALAIEGRTQKLAAVS